MKKFFSLLIMSTLLFTCTKENETAPYSIPVIRTATVADVNSTGATFSAIIESANDLNIIDHGFAWSTDRAFSFGGSEKIRGGAIGNDRSFSMRVTNRLRNGATYYVRAFIETEDNVIVGSRTSFRSAGSSDGPVLTAYSPQTADLGATVGISGDNFSTFGNNNRVFFNDVPAQMLFSSLDSLTVTVPESLDVETSMVTVTVSGGSSSFNEPFNLRKADITGLSYSEVDYGSTITVETSIELPDDKEKISLFIFNDPLNPLELGENEFSLNPLRFDIPRTLQFRSFQVGLGFNNLISTFDETLELPPPTLVRVTQEEVNYGDEITIFGTALSPFEGLNRVFLNGFEVSVTDFGLADPNNDNHDYISFRIPDATAMQYSSRELSLRVVSDGISLDFPEPLSIINPWFRVANAPFRGVSEAFNTSNTDFILLENELWSFQQGTWTQLPTKPGDYHRDRSVFLLNDEIYVGFGFLPASSSTFNRQFWKYSISSGNWITLNEFPGEGRAQTINFSLNGFGYVGTGTKTSAFRNNDFWRYNPAEDSWSQIADYPVFNREGESATTSIGAFTFFGSGGTDILQYDDINDQWLTFGPFIFESGPFGRGSNELNTVVINDDIYLLWGGAFQSYDTANKTLTRISNSPVNGSLLFANDGKFYFTGGNTSNGETIIWEYDPAFER